MRRLLALNAFQFELLVRAQTEAELASRGLDIANAAVLAGFDIDLADIVGLDLGTRVLTVDLPELEPELPLDEGDPEC